MSKSLLVSAALLCCAPSLVGQTTLLNQNFNSGSVPPSGWLESNNGASEGWIADASGTMALHSDVAGWNDNALISPEMDLTAVSQAFIHGVQGQNFSAWRELNRVEITLDGGLSFQTIGQFSGPDGQGYNFHFDLSSYIGQSAVQLSFRYQGSYANEWFLDHVVVDDQNPPPPAPHWPNLPTTFVSGVTWMEDFDSITVGNLPSHMEVNSVNSYTRLADPEGWCNVGQLSGSNGAYSGSNALEMGLIPGSVEYHDVSNALILGLNGFGIDDFHFSFHARQFGD